MEANSSGLECIYEYSYTQPGKQYGEGYDSLGFGRRVVEIDQWSATHPSAKPKTYNEIPRMATLSEMPKSSIVYCIPPVYALLLNDTVKVVVASCPTRQLS